MHCWPGPGDRINSFALVSYIPDPLGKFLDGLRQELILLCRAQSHVSVLPPRELVSMERAERMLTERLAEFAPFTVELKQVSVFESTSVIYLAIGKGYSELRRLHDELNQ